MKLTANKVYNNFLSEGLILTINKIQFIIIIFIYFPLPANLSNTNIPYCHKKKIIILFNIFLIFRRAGVTFSRHYLEKIETLSKNVLIL